MKKWSIVATVCFLFLLTGCGKSEKESTSKTDETTSKVETTQNKEIEEMKKEVTDLKKELSKVKKETPEKREGQSVEQPDKEGNIEQSEKEEPVEQSKMEDNIEQSETKESATTETKSLEEQAHERYREAEAAGASPEAARAYGDGVVDHWEDYKKENEESSDVVNNTEEAVEQVLAIEDQWPKNNPEVTLEVIEQLGSSSLISDETGDYYTVAFKTNDPAPIEKSGFGVKAFRVYTDGRIDVQTRPTGTEFATLVSP